MADKYVKYGNVIESSRADGTLTYTKYVKDEKTGKSTQEQLDEKVNKSDELDASHIKDGAITEEKLDDRSVTNGKLSPSSVTYDKINDKAVITEKLNDRAVTTEKLEEKAITNPKLGDSSVDGRVLREGNVETRHLANESVTADKIKTKGITNDKIADDTLTLDKFDKDLRDAINSATGMPDDLLKKVQDLTENVAELQDSEFPMVPTMSISNDAAVTNSTIKYGVTVKGNGFVPDTLDLRKNDAILTNAPVASGSLVSPIQVNKEVFILTVSKQGRTTKQTSLTRYLCYYGGNSAASISAAVISSLTKKVTANVSFNPTLSTKDGDYIWLVVPSTLTISRVTSAGFDVSLSSPQTITTSLGEFKAYRTLNPLTEGTWNLVIS